jgi:hypothetical protein
VANGHRRPRIGLRHRSGRGRTVSAGQSF